MSSTSDLIALFEKAKETNDSQQQINMYQEIIAMKATGEQVNTIKEQSVYRLGQLLAKAEQPEELESLLKKLRPFFEQIPKAKTAKIVRTLIELVSNIKGASLTLQVHLCQESIAWCNEQKRTFLRQRLEARLADLFLQQNEFTKSLELITKLLREVRRLDDKRLLVEIQLLESKVQHALRNLAKARAALTGARTAANGIYCPPLLQAQIDTRSGILHAEEKEYKTAYSYFFEAFEGLDALDHEGAINALKYMLLCKIMNNKPKEVHAIIHGKLALKYAGRQVEAMNAVANAHNTRSLHDFQEAKSKYAVELQDDKLLADHLDSLYDTLLEQNLCRLIEPFSVVEIQHIAALIDLPNDLIEKKLSTMILDEKVNGVLDQGAGSLIIFDEPHDSKQYPIAIETLQNMGQVVDSLYSKSRKLHE
eukprot:CAMPEP_0201562052 /NCGR_PEP_ID=MMETSP0173_2-20130828/79121_1 /ASSEMBLY_ACC=CAM_ASM_000268 /TAXON_ID=218659 /ORGANISM="Vexillifera sp., Strain DIVA3 564/2" /LENGTH=421 /DNA_ID=CAMNT_0047976589 /DNA_START=822 /DNA_END=2087 /DNA_ORIENTATION=-